MTTFLFYKSAIVPEKLLSYLILKVISQKFVITNQKINMFNNKLVFKKNKEHEIEIKLLYIFFN